MLYKLRQLSFYTTTNTPDIAYQLDAEAVAAKVVYTMTNMQSNCLGGGGSDFVPNIFKEAMPPP